MATGLGLTLVKADEPDESQDFIDQFNTLLDNDAASGAGAMSDEDKEAENAKLSYAYSEYVSEVSIKLQSLFTEAEIARQDIEDRWIKDLRQYRGEYDPEVLANIDPRRSRAYVRITYNKVKTINSRLSDLLFPSSDDKNWGLRPTPVPSLDPTTEQNAMAVIAQQLGRTPNPVETREVMWRIAVERAAGMEREIEDQLAELRYRDIIRSVIHSGNLYGTGVLKGPLVQSKVDRSWKHDGSEWLVQDQETHTPFAEFVSIWDVYPDMSVDTLDDCRYIFHRHILGKEKVQLLASRTDFNSKAIRAILDAHPTGNTVYKRFETELSTLRDSPTTAPTRDNRFEILEFWGYLDIDDVKKIKGVEIPKGYEGPEIACNIWMMNNVILKAVVAPIGSSAFPFYFYYFAKDETNIFGEGIASILREPQMLSNASVRVMMDNAAISAGPVMEANIDLLPEDEDPTDIHPFRVILRQGSGVEASAPALRVNSLPSYTNEFMGMFEMFLRMGDDVSTIPRYMYGDTGQVAGGASRTASGLSMLMGAANVTLKEQVKNFDEGITKPFISALYDWNMKFSDNEDIKGDYSILALGTASLIAKEVRSESLLKFLQITSNPVDMPITRREKLIREIAKTLDLDDDDLVKSDQELQLERQQQAQEMEQNRMMELQKTAVEAQFKAQAGGHAPVPGQI